MPDTTVAAGVSTSPTSPSRPGLWTRLKRKFDEQQNTKTSLVNTGRLVFAACRLAWVPIVGSIFGSLLFLVPDQSQDAIRAILGFGKWKVALGLLLALLLWAVTAYVWARVMTMHPRAHNKLPRDCDEKIASQCLDTLPQLVGFSVIFVMAVVVACVVLQLPFWVYAPLALPFVPVMGVLLLRFSNGDTGRIKWTYLVYALLVSAVVFFIDQTWDGKIQTDWASLLSMISLLTGLTLVRQVLFWLPIKLLSRLSTPA